MSNVVEGPWLKARPPCLFHYMRLRTEEQLDSFERLLLGDEIYACSLLDLNPIFDVRTLEYNPWHADPAPGPGQRTTARQAAGGADCSKAAGDRFAHLGVVCFSEHQNSVAVWRNQGDRQRAACLRFATAAADRAESPLLPVDYAQDASVLGRILGPDLAGTTRSVLTKPPAMREEAEWRWLLPGRAGTYMKINPLLIDGVVLGPLMPDGLRARVSQIASRRRAPTALYQARVDPDSLQVAVVSNA